MSIDANEIETLRALEREVASFLEIMGYSSKRAALQNALEDVRRARNESGVKSAPLCKCLNIEWDIINKVGVCKGCKKEIKLANTELISDGHKNPDWWLCNGNIYKVQQRDDAGFGDFYPDQIALSVVK